MQCDRKWCAKRSALPVADAAHFSTSIVTVPVPVPKETETSGARAMIATDYRYTADGRRDVICFMQTLKCSLPAWLTEKI